MDAVSSWSLPKTFGDSGIFGGGPLPYVLAPLAILLIALLVRWAWIRLSNRQNLDQ